MSEQPISSTHLSPEEHAFLAMHMRQQEDTSSLITTEPIAVIGMGCRFPGGSNSPQEYWELLKSRKNAISEIPKQRWDAESFYDQDRDAPGKMQSRWGGFLDTIDQFDPSCFGISPREAARMDPQQRLLLEIAWEALEHAGIPIEQIAGSQTGVFLGIFSSDHALFDFADTRYVDAYTAFSGAHCITANRISYIFDLKGPSIALDTACSSSLTSIHLACQSLRHGDCDMALAGGSNLILSPTWSIAFSKWGMLSADGLCKTFDSSANGYVRGEGCGLVVLKRLSDAIAHQDNILAVVLGSALNEDGRTKRMTAPDSHAQEQVIRKAIQRAGIQPSHISYVETHGTGTLLGDPIEFSALSAVLNEPRSSDQPCVLGAVKTNIGHLETAAGVAGFIKVVLALQHEEIPANLHFNALNPHISLENTPFVIPTEAISWPHKENSRRYAAVSSFGAGGANAHMILTEAPSYTQHQVALQRAAYVLPLSTRTPEQLAALAKKYFHFLSANPMLPLADICYTASTRRSHHSHRTALVATSHQDMLEQLKIAARDSRQPAKGDTSSGIAFVFPGQGGQWLGMGKQLYEQEPVFRNVIERCEASMHPYIDWSVVTQLYASEEQSRLQEINVVQPLLFAIQIGLAALWRSWGITPGAVIGHSMGEVAASYIAGALSLDDACSIICQRSNLLKQVSGQGAMAVVGLPADDVQLHLHGYETRLAIAACNGPRSTVIAGASAPVAEVVARLQQQNIFCRMIKVDVASHSPQVDPLCAELVQRLADIHPQSGSIPIYSTVLAQRTTGQNFNAQYWMQNLRNTVQFIQAVQQTISSGLHTFIEISPHPTLITSLEQCLEHEQQAGSVLPSLQRNMPEQQGLYQTLATLYQSGHAINWHGLYPTGGNFIPFPSYPWKDERYPIRRETVSQYRTWHKNAGEHPFLDSYFKSPIHEDTHFWRVTLSPDITPFLYDHKVRHLNLIPGMIYLDMALFAASHIWKDATISLNDIHFRQAVALQEDITHLQLALIREAAQMSATFQFFKAELDGTQSQLLVKGSIQFAAPIQPARQFSITDIQQRCPDILDQEEIYMHLAQRGLHYGPGFQSVHKIWRQEGEALARVALPTKKSTLKTTFTAHPVLLDACFHTWLTSLPSSVKQQTIVPIGMQHIHMYAPVHDHLWAYTRQRSKIDAESQESVCDVYLLDDTGRVIVEMEGTRTRNLGVFQEVGRKEETAEQAVARWLYVPQWHEVPYSEHELQSSHHASDSWLIFAPTIEIGEQFRPSLHIRKERYLLIIPGEQDEGRDGIRSIRPGHLEDIQHVFQSLDHEHLRCRGIVYISDTVASAHSPTQELPTRWDREVNEVLSIVQTIGMISWHTVPRFWLITSGAHDITTQSTPIKPLAGALVGLGRVADLEHPEYQVTCIDVSPNPDEEALRSLVNELHMDTQEHMLALRGQKRFLPRLVHTDLNPETSTLYQPAFQTTIHADATYLLTGGLGGIGLQTAAWLVEQGARTLVLMGRSEPTNEARKAIEQMKQAGAQILIFQADVTRHDQVAQVLQTIETTGLPALHGIIHAAGLLDDGMLLHQNQERFKKVLAPKVEGAWYLHQLTLDAPLDFFLFFSSAASLLGSAGQGNYAAGNAFMDTLAHYRRALGKPALSINWGPWSGLGLVSRQDRSQHVSSLGFYEMTPQQGLMALSLALQRPFVQIGVLPIDWSRYAEQFSIQRTGSFLADVLAQLPEQHAKAQKRSILQQMHSWPISKQKDILLTHLRTLVAEVLGFTSIDAIDIERGFFEIGINSLMAVEIRSRLLSDLENLYALPSTLAFDYPTVKALHTYLVNDVLHLEGSEIQSREESADTLSPHLDAKEEDLAILLEQVKELSSEDLLMLLHKHQELEGHN